MITPDNIKKIIIFRAQSPEGKRIFEKVLNMFFSADKPINISYELSYKELIYLNSVDLYEMYKITQKLKDELNLNITKPQILDSILVNCYINILIKYKLDIKMTVNPANPNILN
jgi:hypothetical protein